MIDEIYSEYNGLALKLDEVNAQIQEFQQNIKLDEAVQKEKMKEMRGNLKKMTEEYKESLEKYKKIREDTKVNREEMTSKEKIFNENNKKLNALKDEYFSNENLYKNKAMELSQYMNIFQKIKNCVTFFLI